MRNRLRSPRSSAKRASRTTSSASPQGRGANGARDAVGALTPFQDARTSDWLRSLLSSKEQQSEQAIGSLDVHVVEAHGIIASDLGGTSDPYCILSIHYSDMKAMREEWPACTSDSCKAQTPVEKRTVHPEWDHHTQVRACGTARARA